MKYYIKDSTQGKYIFAYVCFKKYRYRFSTGIEVKNVNNFNPTPPKSAYLNNKEYNYIGKNQFLDDLSETIDHRLKELILVKNISEDDFRKEINKIAMPDKIETEIQEEENKIEQVEELPPISFFDSFNNFINERELLIEFSKSTTDKYKVVYRKLKEFGESFLNFDSINMEFYKDFQNYLRKEGKTDSTVYLYFKVIKTFLSWAFEKELHHNLIFRKKEFRAIKSPALVAFALTKEEFILLRDFDLSDSKRLERTRDLFVIQVMTACRVSDLMKITKNDVEGDILSIVQKKTNKTVKIAINKTLRELLNKYQYKLPRLSSQKYNDNLKLLATKIGILQEKINVVKKQSKRQILLEKYKYEYFTSHCARRTAATLALKSGLTASEVMKITGHQNLASFELYIKMSEDEAIKAVGEALDF